MTLNLNRYWQNALQANGHLFINGDPFCETREALLTGRYKNHGILPAGRYVCRPCPTPLSPMTLKVVLRPGQSRVYLAFDSLRQRLAHHILLGQADSTLLPQHRQLIHVEKTFARFTRRVYQAYEEEEEFVLIVQDAPPVA